MWVTVETNRCWYLVTSLGSPDTGRKKREAKLRVKEEPVKEERFSTRIHLNKISDFGTVSPYTQFYILPLSLSIWRKTENERKEKKKDIYVHGLFIYDIFDTLKLYIYV